MGKADETVLTARTDGYDRAGHLLRGFVGFALLGLGLLALNNQSINDSLDLIVPYILLDSGWFCTYLLQPSWSSI